MFLIEKQGFHFGLIWVYLVVTPMFSMWKGSCRCNRKWWTTRFWAAGIWETVPPPAGLFFLFPAKTRWVEWCWRDMHVSGGPYLSSAVSGGERSIETPIPAFSGDCGGGVPLQKCSLVPQLLKMMKFLYRGFISDKEPPELLKCCSLNPATKF